MSSWNLEIPLASYKVAAVTDKEALDIKRYEENLAVTH